MKICTMNCGPAAGDTRSRGERMRDCDECITATNTGTQPCLPDEWSVKRVGDAIHIERPDGRWCGYMRGEGGGPAHDLTYGFLNAMLAAAPSFQAIDYKAMYEKMCKRCDFLDGELAKYTGPRNMLKPVDPPPSEKLAKLLESIGWSSRLDPQWENLKAVMPTIRYMFRASQPDTAMTVDEVLAYGIVAANTGKLVSVVLANDADDIGEYRPEHVIPLVAYQKCVQPASGENRYEQ